MLDNKNHCGVKYNYDIKYYDSQFPSLFSWRKVGFNFKQFYQG